MSELGSYTPKYLRAAERLRRLIHDGEFQPGDRLPMQQELAAQLGISKSTLIVAIDLLVREGLLVSRYRGRQGTTVTDMGPDTVRFGRPLQSIGDVVRAAYRQLSDVEDTLDFPHSSVANGEQAEALRVARRHIAAARNALAAVGGSPGADR